jgi:HPt (histidine-containing phosphotransfer) domain-containing protein
MIDWVRVADLRSEIGEDSFHEVITLFLEETDEVTDRLSLGRPSADLGKDLHFLKGSSLNLGFRELARLCSDGERHFQTQGPAGIDLGRILGCYQASRRSFRDGIANLSAA